MLAGGIGKPFAVSGKFGQFTLVRVDNTAHSKAAVESGSDYGLLQRRLRDLYFQHIKELVESETGAPFAVPHVDMDEDTWYEMDGEAFKSHLCGSACLIQTQEACPEYKILM